MSNSTDTEHFKFKDIPSLVKQTYQDWNGGDPFGQSAAVAYYALFSLPGLLMVVITVAGIVLGEQAVTHELSAQLTDVLGQKTAESVETMINNTNEKDNSTLSTIIGIATLLFGATGLFIQLQKSLNKIWDVKAREDSGWKKLLKDRATSLGIIISIGFLLLISLVLTSVLSLLSDWLSTMVPDFLMLAFFVANFLISYGMITVLFAIIFRVLPDAEITWKVVWVGAAITALLFVIGKFLLGLYFGNSDPASAFGAAGSMVLLLLWISYSCLILFFGAEFTQVFAKRYGRHRIRPSDHAEWTAEYKIKNNLIDCNLSDKDKEELSKK